MSFKQVDPLRQINTYIVNLERRSDRREDVLSEFKYRSEFDVKIVTAIEDSFGAMGLWKTLCLIVQDALVRESDYILVCEDDHKFTEVYSEKKLRQCIEDAQLLNSDILLGGVSWSGDSIEVDQSIFWTKSFSGLQFTIIFKKFFRAILEASLDGYQAADYFICNISNCIFIMHPFISTQKGYSYSDVTPMNNQVGRVEQLFVSSEHALTKHRKVSEYFKQSAFAKLNIRNFDTDDLFIPTYIINLKKRKDRLDHIKKQFDSKQEFLLNYLNGVVHPNGQVGLWKSIRKIIKKAIRNNEDVILICEDDHEFIQNYNKDFLIKNIHKAHGLGADVLLGGISNFQSGVKASDNLFWINDFYCTQFMIVYKQFFQEILKADYSEPMSVDGKISSISFNKLVIYPFISVQKDFGYSDITIRDSSEIRTSSPFYETMSRFDIVLKKYNELTKV